jgi:hypothetical protein
MVPVSVTSLFLLLTDSNTRTKAARAKVYKLTQLTNPLVAEIKSVPPPDGFKPLI